jgi:hypothetical protein
MKTIRTQIFTAKPKRCIKISKSITPTLPSPSEGEGEGGGAKVTKGEVLVPSIKSISATRIKGHKEYFGKSFCNNRVKIIKRRENIHKEKTFRYNKFISKMGGESLRVSSFRFHFGCGSAALRSLWSDF